MQVCRSNKLILFFKIEKTMLEKTSENHVKQFFFDVVRSIFFRGKFRQHNIHHTIYGAKKTEIPMEFLPFQHLFEIQMQNG